MSGGNGNGRNKPPLRIPLFESDPHVREAILQAVRDGMRDADACHAAGVHPASLRRWKLSQGAAYHAFRAELQRARMEGKRARLERIRLAAATDWKADAWILARTCPEEFSEKRILEHVRRGSGGKRREAIRDPEIREALDRAASRLGTLRDASEPR